MYCGFTGISRDQYWFLPQFKRLVVKEIDKSSSFVVVFGVAVTVVFVVVLGSYILSYVFRSTLVRVPAGTAGECFSPRSPFCADFYFGIRFIPVLPH